MTIFVHCWFILYNCWFILYTSSRFVLVALMKTCAHCGTRCYPRCHFCDFCKTEFPKRAPKIKQIKHAYKAWACLRQKVHAHLCSHTCMYMLIFRLQCAHLCKQIHPGLNLFSKMLCFAKSYCIST